MGISHQKKVRPKIPWRSSGGINSGDVVWVHFWNDSSWSRTIHSMKVAVKRQDITSCPSPSRSHVVLRRGNSKRRVQSRNSWMVAEGLIARQCSKCDRTSRLSVDRSSNVLVAMLVRATMWCPLACRITKESWMTLCATKVAFGTCQQELICYKEPGRHMPPLTNLRAWSKGQCTTTFLPLILYNRQKLSRSTKPHGAIEKMESSKTIVKSKL